MNDVIEMLEHHAPVVADPTDHAVASARGQLLARIDRWAATEAPATRGRWRRLTLTGVAFVATLGASGAAAATGLLPDAVRDRLGIFDTGDPGDDGFRPVLDEAHLVVSAETPTGAVFELWRAPSVGGGLCEYERIVSSSGTEDGGVGCSLGAGDLGPLPDVSVSAVAMLPDPDFAIYGRAPAAARTVEITFSNHEVRTLPVTGGWFATTVPFEIGGGEDPVTIETTTARDAVGQVVAQTSPGPETTTGD